jgi:hypothetical protein
MKYTLNCAYFQTEFFLDNFLDFPHFLFHDYKILPHIFLRFNITVDKSLDIVDIVFQFIFTTLHFFLQFVPN